MYNYQSERKNIFTEKGQVLFLAIRAECASLLKTAGAARMDRLIAGNIGDTWHMLACVDRLVELGEIREITDDKVSGQNRVFVSAF